MSSINYLLSKKIKNNALSKNDIYEFVNMSVKREIKDYQISTMLNAIYFNDMNFNEIYWLTIAMRDSGYVYKFQDKNVIDKHSTGGVGDKVTLIMCPILAALDVPVFKISGRGLGHTGGTIDKLESIGVNTKINLEDAKKIFKKHKITIIEQTENLVPADKIFYAIRNDTSTVMSIPLIVSSIMSKKLALGSEHIYLDIKVGNGALFSDLKSAKIFGDICIKIAKKEKKRVICHFTNMNEPLGRTIGNKIEIVETLDFLQGKFDSKNLKELIYRMTSDILIDFKKTKSYVESKKEIDKVIKSSMAFTKFIEWSKSQDCKLTYDDFVKLDFNPKYKETIYAKNSGNFKILSTLLFGEVSFQLGGGRLNKDINIDFNAGLKLLVDNGDAVKKNSPIIEIYSDSPITKDIINKLNESYKIVKSKIKKNKIMLGVLK